MFLSSLLSGRASDRPSTGSGKASLFCRWSDKKRDQTLCCCKQRLGLHPSRPVLYELSLPPFPPSSSPTCFSSWVVMMSRMLHPVPSPAIQRLSPVLPFPLRLRPLSWRWMTSSSGAGLVLVFFLEALGCLLERWGHMDPFHFTQYLMDLLTRATVTPPAIFYK